MSYWEYEMNPSIIEVKKVAHIRHLKLGKRSIETGWKTEDKAQDRGSEIAERLSDIGQIPKLLQYGFVDRE